MYVCKAVTVTRFLCLLVEVQRRQNGVEKKQEGRETKTQKDEYV